MDTISNVFPFAAGCLNALNARLAQVRAIISLNTARDVYDENTSSCVTAYAAAAEIIGATVTAITFEFSELIEPEVAAETNGFLTKSKALIELAASSVDDDEAGDARELVVAAAGDLIRLAMERLEVEAHA
ncbi:hypothetical protein PY254_11485 [Rhodanobacter sp. AS-Z3]|uniref:hypothetical protein n=1 Tax=Rhodanobacter sp. AS-Z3 TaxID=3031330 RepID=UPI00247B1EC1|nr:hypothetical protein [Rhodanobacter sp. AS-Z3]WEN13864.1 hypothetical protein PY254_11485 [Rhodanobacter sp. AS-Z3]